MSYRGRDLVEGAVGRHPPHIGLVELAGSDGPVAAVPHLAAALALSGPQLDSHEDSLADPLMLKRRVVHDDLAVDELRARRPVAAKELLDAQPGPGRHAPKPTEGL